MNYKKYPYETFNNGVCTIYKLADVSKVGFRPRMVAKFSKKFHFGYRTIGVKRNFEAEQAGIQLDELIEIPMDRSISTTNIVVINDVAYEIKQIQHKNDTKPHTTWLSLVRTEVDYEFL